MYTNFERRYCTMERGCRNEADYRMYFTNKDGKYISPWHDIPLYANVAAKTFNMVCEIPRWTNAKLEICTKEPLNPLKHDMKNGKVRFVDNCFPHHGYIWNYGAIPQTWEDPHHCDSDTSSKGDNDPIDVLEIGQKIAKRGDVLEVKVLGTLALIDEGETDWKIVAIDVTDPLAHQLNDIKDLESHMPGFLAATREWFKIYKMPTGKPANKFAFDGQFKNKAYALKVIEETHNFWKKLVNKIDTGDLVCKCTECNECSARLKDTECNEVVNSFPEYGLPKPIPQDVEKWHFVC